MSKYVVAACLVLSFAAMAFAAELPAQPAFWTFAPTPPMGWNSYDSFGDSVTEAEVVANAVYMKRYLFAAGYRYVVVDYRWYDAGANSGDLKDRAGANLAADEFGRLMPAMNRFPSAQDGHGFASLATKLHALGLKLGLHLMRGIPRQSVAANTPIAGSAFHAADAADTSNVCVWCPDMFGVNATTAAGQAWYDSIVRLYAGWGVDYLKVDDLSHPYATDEIEAIRRAIDKCARPIVLSLSPGPTPLEQADHVKLNANLWRISNDFWDTWESVDHQFDLLEQWQGQAGPGHFPDLDMIPLGHLAQRNLRYGGKPRWSRLTHDEQISLLTLWAMAPSPLMLGMNLPDNDVPTLRLISNSGVLQVDQDPLGLPGQLMNGAGDVEAWKRDMADRSVAIALFNRSGEAQDISFTWHFLGVSGNQLVYDLWAPASLGVVQEKLTMHIAAHGAALVRMRGVQ